MVGRLIIFACILISALGGCWSMPGNASSSMRCPPLIVDLYLGEPVNFDIVLDDLSQVDIVYVGEHHTISRHHQLQVDIMGGLAERRGISGLAMEMFTWEHQSRVDEWLQSTDPVSVLAHKLGAGAWTNLRDYDPVLLKARDLGIPVICLNVPEQIVRRVARDGLESLSDAERELLPKDIEPINPDYSRLLGMKLRVHRAFEGKSLTRIILSQALRDATMASNVVRFLKKNPHKNKPLLVIAGSGHLSYGFGIPERVKKHLDVSFRIILPSESGELKLSEAEQRQALDIDISHEDVKFINRPIADYLSVVPLKSNDDETDGVAPNIAAIIHKSSKVGGMRK